MKKRCHPSILYYTFHSINWSQPSNIILILCAFYVGYVMNDNNIRIAVEAWLSNSDTATDTYGHIATWDTSAVTDMSELFRDATDFNDDITSWVVSSVTNMEGMFWSASSFNQDLTSWDISSVVNMVLLFYHATGFHQELCWTVDEDVVLTLGMFEDSPGVFACDNTMTDENIESAVELWL